MKLPLPGGVRCLPAALYAISSSVRGAESGDTDVSAAHANRVVGPLSEFLSLESVLIAVFVLLVVAVIAHKTKAP